MILCHFIDFSAQLLLLGQVVVVQVIVHVAFDALERGVYDALGVDGVLFAQ